MKIKINLTLKNETTKHSKILQQKKNKKWYWSTKTKKGKHTSIKKIPAKTYSLAPKVTSIHFGWPYKKFLGNSKMNMNKWFLWDWSRFFFCYGPDFSHHGDKTEKKMKLSHLIFYRHGNCIDYDGKQNEIAKTLRGTIQKKEFISFFPTWDILFETNMTNSTFSFLKK